MPGEHRGFFADPRVAGEAVRSVAIEAAAIMASIAQLDEVGSLIPASAA
jgi:hypothetical protein